MWCQVWWGKLYPGFRNFSQARWCQKSACLAMRAMIRLPGWIGASWYDSCDAWVTYPKLVQIGWNKLSTLERNYWNQPKHLAKQNCFKSEGPESACSWNLATLNNFFCLPTQIPFPSFSGWKGVVFFRWTTLPCAFEEWYPNWAQLEHLLSSTFRRVCCHLNRGQV